MRLTNKVFHRGVGNFSHCCTTQERERERVDYQQPFNKAFYPWLNVVTSGPIIVILVNVQERVGHQLLTRFPRRVGARVRHQLALNKGFRRGVRTH